MNKLFLFILLATIGYVGFRMGEGSFGEEKKKVSLSVHPERVYPLAENQTFTFVVYASNHAPWCKRSLASIFAQDYGKYRVIFIDDASIDHTYEEARAFVVHAAQDERAILMRNETKLGLCASLYRAMEHCSDREIVIALQAKDWLAQEDALSRLNNAFQNPDVWAATSCAMSYPDYQKEGSQSLLAFYAGLLKTVPLSTLFIEGQIAQVQEAYEKPLLERCGGRVKSFAGSPFLLVNRANCKEQSFVSSQTQSPLLAFPTRKIAPQPVDFLIFSYDRPLQLQALLESIRHYVSGAAHLFVIYRASDERYQKAYEELAVDFPNISWKRQSENPHKDFKPLVCEVLRSAPSSHILFAVDDMVVKDFVDLTECTEWMEKTAAFGFYLRLGTHVRHCYMMNEAQEIPPHLPLHSEILAWDFRAAQHDWQFAGTLDMTIYRKADILPVFETLQFKHPNRLEQAWAGHGITKDIGLCFTQSKVVNLPLNIVNPSDCPHSHFMDAEELLGKWNEGLKMDTSPLFGIENPSPHIDYAPQFVKR